MTVRLRSPAEFYLKALIVHPNGYSDADIAQIMDDQRLVFYSEEFIQRSRRKVRPPPESFFPHDECHLPSYSYITSECINSVFLRSLEMKMALKVLEKPRVQEFIEAMLIVNVPYPAIAAYTTRKLGVYCNPEALALYKHYFWNIDLLDSTELRYVIGAEMEMSVARIPELKGRDRLRTAAYYKDARKIAADLPHSPTTAILAQARLGMMPNRNDLAIKLLETRNIAVMRAMEAAHQDAPGDSQKFLNFVNGVRIIEEVLQMVQDPQGQMRDQLQSIALRTDTAPLKSIHQLSDGHHTVDIAPIKDPENAEPSADTHSGHQDR